MNLLRRRKRFQNRIEYGINGIGEKKFYEKLKNNILFPRKILALIFFITFKIFIHY